MLAILWRNLEEKGRISGFQTMDWWPYVSSVAIVRGKDLTLKLLDGLVVSMNYFFLLIKVTK